MFENEKVSYTQDGKKATYDGYTLKLSIFNDYSVDLIFVDCINNNRAIAGRVTHKSGNYAVLVELTPACSTSTIVHESVHVAQAVCLDIAGGECVATCGMQNEVMAYTTCYVAEEIILLRDSLYTAEGVLKKPKKAVADDKQDLSKKGNLWTLIKGLVQK